MARLYGPIRGVNVGTVYESRRAVAHAGIHRPIQAGICGGKDEPAESIVVSGGYADDEDFGDVIIYTGFGGRDAASGRQVQDQELVGGNRALVHNMDEGVPVRVVRGYTGDPNHSPKAGYRYDGCYFVDSYWAEEGHDGYRVYRYRLERDRAIDVPDEVVPPVTVPPDLGPSRRVETTTQRIVRSTAMTKAVKDLYNRQCQVCGVELSTPAGLYAEGAHIRPLGRPHDGPDDLSNLLCLCPNDHIRFDSYAIVLTDELEVLDVRTGVRSPLRVAPSHRIDPGHVTYHRALGS